jgi:hypothetical protein
MHKFKAPQARRLFVQHLIDVARESTGWTWDQCARFVVILAVLCLLVCGMLWFVDTRLIAPVTTTFPKAITAFQGK